MGYVRKSLLHRLDECFDILFTEQERRLGSILEVVEVEKHVFRLMYIISRRRARAWGMSRLLTETAAARI